MYAYFLSHCWFLCILWCGCRYANMSPSDKKSVLSLWYSGEKCTIFTLCITFFNTDLGFNIIDCKLHQCSCPETIPRYKSRCIGSKFTLIPEIIPPSQDLGQSSPSTKRVLHVSLDFVLLHVWKKDAAFVFTNPKCNIMCSLKFKVYFLMLTLLSKYSGLYITTMLTVFTPLMQYRM